jgi:trimethylamine--corrinoid protein Co-methyltransferase
MARPQVSLLSDEEIEILDEHTLTVLEDVGVSVPVPEALDLLEAGGATVDRTTSVARIPRELVGRCLETVPDQVLLAARDPKHDVVLGDGSVTFTSDGTATYVVDDLTGERFEGSAEYQRTLNRLFDALPDVDYIWPTISARDLDPVACDLEIQSIAWRNCTKHVQDEIRTPELAAPMLDMMAAVAGATPRERPVFSQINCTLAPLSHDPAMTEASMVLARAGVPIAIMPMPLMGTTAPITVAGVTVMCMAELLSAVVIFQLAAPGCPLIASPEPDSADLRSGLYICASPEGRAATLACIEMSKYYDLPTQGGGFDGDAKAPDYQNGIEGADVLLDVLVGADSCVGLGCFDGAQATSLATIVLHNDAAGLVKEELRRVRSSLDADSCLIDDIRAVGPGGHFMGQRSTRQQAHDVWQPSVLRRGTFSASQGRTVIEDAVERAQEILATHEVPPLPDDVDRHIDEVIATQRRLTVDTA